MCREENVMRECRLKWGLGKSTDWVSESPQVIQRTKEMMDDRPGVYAIEYRDAPSKEAPTVAREVAIAWQIAGVKSTGAWCPMRTESSLKANVDWYNREYGDGTHWLVYRDAQKGEPAQPVAVEISAPVLVEMSPDAGKVGAIGACPTHTHVEGSTCLIVGSSIFIHGDSYEPVPFGPLGSCHPRAVGTTQPPAKVFPNILAIAPLSGPGPMGGRWGATPE
jgi:hypothetical protein